MKFPNAQKGVTKLWVGALIGIIVTVIAVIGSILLGFNNGSDVLKKIGVGVVGAGGIAGLVVFIIELIGLHQASEDDKNFNSALWMVIFGLIISIIAGVIGAINNDICTTVAKYLGILGSATSLCSLVYIFKGIMAVSEKLNNEDMVKKGRRLILIIYVLLIADMVFNLFGNIFETNAADWMKIVVSVLVVAAAVLEVVTTVITFLYYTKAKEVFKK